MFDESGIMYPGTQASDDDKRLFVTFSQEARLDKRATVQDGINRYKNVEFITIRIPGDKTVSIHRPVVASDKVRFPLQYAAFKNSTGAAVVGTPLTMLLGITPARAKELEYFNVRTVEQLAAMPDGVGGAQMMGIQSLRQAAQAFVAAQKEQAPLLKVQAELTERDNQIAALQDTVQKQGAIVERLLATLGAKEDKAPPAKTK